MQRTKIPVRNDALVAIWIDKTAVSRSRPDNRFLGIDVGYLDFAPRGKKAQRGARTRPVIAEDRRRGIPEVDSAVLRIGL